MGKVIAVLCHLPFVIFLYKRYISVSLVFCYRYRVVGKTVPEDVAIFFMIEIFSILEAVHNCNIIHADIKPDNFLIQVIPESNASDDIFTEGPACLKLIDFGRSIDMKAFPEGTTFTEVVSHITVLCMYLYVIIELMNNRMGDKTEP